MKKLYLANKNRQESIFEYFINVELFLYILSLFIFTYRSGYNNISNLFGFILISSVLFKIFITKRKIKINFFIIILFIFFLISYLSYFVAFDPKYTLIYIKTLLLLIILVFSLINYIDNISL